MVGDGEESEGAQLKRGYCLHIKTLPLTPRKSSNLPCKVLQFNFSIVLRDNPLIIEEEVALSPGTEGEGSQRAPLHQPRSGFLSPSSPWPFCLFISTRGVSGRSPISTALQMIFPSVRPDQLDWWRLIGVWVRCTRRGNWGLAQAAKALWTLTLYRLKITS